MTSHPIPLGSLLYDHEQDIVAHVTQRFQDLDTDAYHYIVQDETHTTAEEFHQDDVDDVFMVMPVRVDYSEKPGRVLMGPLPEPAWVESGGVSP